MDGHGISAETRISRLRRSRRGATAIEYALIAGGIAVAIAAILMTLGGTLNTLFTTVNALF
jgi:pilus assembly protein Flp/PilA